MQKENYKNFKLESRDDFIIYLNYLIMLAKRQLYYYRKYLGEMKETLDTKNFTLKGIDYEEFRNKVSYLNLYLFNLFADETKSALSYRKFRKLINRKKNDIATLDDLPQRINEYLNELNNIRNWGAHIPESLLNAEFEAIGLNGRMISREDVINKPSPIYVNIFHIYEMNWLEKLYEECKELYDSYTDILQQMRKDYSKLIGYQAEVFLKYPDIPRKNLYDNHIPNISFDMQNKTYKKNYEDNSQK